MKPRGFILLPVVLMLSLVAAVAYLGQRGTALGSAMANTTDQEDKARYAAEAGLQRVTAQLHTKGCGGTYPWLLAPLKDTAFDGASYTANTALTTSGSPVTVYSTGTYGDANVTLTRKNIPVHQATAYTASLQPPTSGLDTYLDTASGSSNADKKTLMATPGSAYPIIQFAFDPLVVPAGSHVTLAKLSLYAEGGSNAGSVAVHRILRDWTESAATWTRADSSTAWSTAGGDVHATPVATTNFNGGPVWLSWDITSLADRWLKGSLPNQGLQVRAASPITGLTFTSSDGDTAAQRPKLDITFLPPCGWTPPVVTVTLNPSADTHVDVLSSFLNFGAQPTFTLANLSEARSLMKFDVSSIAPGKTVQTATLRLYFSALAIGTKLGNNLTANVYAVNSAWNETETTWLLRTALNLWPLAGGDIGSTVLANKTLAKNMTPGQWVEFDITAQAQSWIDGVSPNNGVMLKVPTLSTDILVFNSREAAANPPELVVVYK